MKKAGSKRPTSSISKPKEFDMTMGPAKDKDVDGPFLLGKKSIMFSRRPKEDRWAHRSAGMLCQTCMYYVKKVEDTGPRLGSVEVGRCRRHAPTINGWPVMFKEDWCGDHRIDENKL